jgi:uncharacterized protein (DUF58 family)
VSFDTESRITRTVASTGTATHTRFATTSGGRAVSIVVWWIRAWRWLVPTVVRGLVWLRDTVTPAGWLVVAVLLFLPVGIALGWPEFAVAGAIAAVLLLAAIPFLFGGQSYAVDLTLSTERVVAGDSISGSIAVRNSSKRLALPGRIDIPTGSGIAEVHVPLLRPEHTHAESLSIATQHRGIIPVGPVTSVRTDPIGILKREIEWVDLHDIFVHPVTVPIPSTSAGFIKDLEGNPTTNIVDSDISFHAIREYAYGDAQRNIHWKSTAKTGTLMVRQFEETRRSRLAVVLSLDVAEYASDAEFEMAVSASASLGVRAIRDGRDLAVAMSDEIPEFVMKAVRSIKSLNAVSARGLLDDFSGVESRTSVMPIENVCSLVTQVVTDMSIAFVVCGSKMTARRLQSIAVQFPTNVAVVAVLCDQDAEPAFRDFAGLKVMTISVLDDLRNLMARAGR